MRHPTVDCRCCLRPTAPFPFALRRSISLLKAVQGAGLGAEGSKSEIASDRGEPTNPATTGLRRYRAPSARSAAARRRQHRRRAASGSSSNLCQIALSLRCCVVWQSSRRSSRCTTHNWRRLQTEWSNSPKERRRDRDAHGSAYAAPSCCPPITPLYTSPPFVQHN